MLTCTDVDYDLAKEARTKRKERVAKNERQQKQNLAQAAGTGTGARKKDIDRTLAMTRTSTASMGKFDRVLDGEKKLRGVKRKVRTVPPFSSFSHSLLAVRPD
jgi:regulator of ribosome biosynthesis